MAGPSTLTTLKLASGRIVFVPLGALNKKAFCEYNASVWGAGSEGSVGSEGHRLYMGRAPCCPMRFDAARQTALGIMTTLSVTTCPSPSFWLSLTSSGILTGGGRCR